MISEQLLAEEDLAKGDILSVSNQKIGSFVSFETKGGSKVILTKWRFPEPNLISRDSEESLVT
jgi:hypothetical protein